MLASLYAPIRLTDVLPELIVVAGGCVTLVAGLSGTERARRTVPWLALAALVAALITIWAGLAGSWDALSDIRGGLFVDNLAQFVRMAALIVGVIIVLVAWYDATPAECGEFFSMALFSIAGLMLVGPSADLVVLFLAIELVSIPSYVMVTLSQRKPHSVEAGTKYFYLGALAAAITAYGFSFLYGVIGSAALNGEAIDRIRAALHAPGTLEYALATAGIVISIGGLLFKIAAVPLHFYIADVYQGAAASVAGLLGFVPKLAGMVAIFKVITLTGWRTTEGGLFWLLWLVSAFSMTVGNVLALRQTNVKRMLGYSGIAHAGYMLVGVLAGPSADGGFLGDGTAAVLYYVVIYGLANLGAFALLGLLRQRGEPCETVRDIAGLILRHPGPALLMALAMITLMGLPPTPGFWGKLSLFGSALAVARDSGPEVRTWLISLVVLAVINSAIAAAYYLRVTAAVLLYESEEVAEPAPREAQYVGAIMCGFLLLVYAFWPNGLLNVGRSASGDLQRAAITVPASESPVLTAPDAGTDAPTP